MSVFDTDRPRNAWLGPLAIAVVLLAVIGGAVGFLLATNGGDDEPGLGAGPDPTVRPTLVAEAPDTPTYAPDPTYAPTPTGQPVRTTAPGHGRPTTCPAHTVTLARETGSAGDLSLTLYLRTRHSEVWICTDPHGTLFYQGHSGQPGEKLVEGVNALFLTDVSATGGGYVATNHTDRGTTRYRVTADKLVIEHEGGGAETQPAI
ncbi:hypothetical protein [Polymorphospora rubra]|uniref:Uncharacterized protein n=1 Tax=Polymorphospora rubra TaxID=338584 RepID=A0A810MTD3_9ACTN|nr:hypothetical protein [Polymorphospora rubra]BCJ63884.1 hypothetical protein Prubr_09050 [Polymorphospora rubra]